MFYYQFCLRGEQTCSKGSKLGEGTPASA